MLHLRQLSLFGMICRKNGSLLKQHALNVYTYVTPIKKSWFLQIRDICLLYSLPHPYDFLQSPLPKDSFKKVVKSKVIDYWERLLRDEAQKLKSLTHFKSNFMSLTRTHPLWTTTCNSSSKVSMARVQAVMLSGRYPCGSLTRHWSKDDGSCRLSPECKGTLEDVRHIVCECPALQFIRDRMIAFTLQLSRDLPPEVSSVLLEYCHPAHPNFLSFILDCSTLSPVIRIVQKFDVTVLDPFFTVTRTWLYVIHRERLKILGLWKLTAH